MEFVGDLIGILGALVDALGIPGMALIGVFAFIFYWTRKRPGRRYDRPPRPVAESQESWWFSG